MGGSCWRWADAFSRVEAQRCGSALRTRVVRATGPKSRPPHPQPQRPGVVAPESPGCWAARHPTGEQLRRGGTVARVGCREWAGGGEPEQRLGDLDLRVRALVPEVVIVRVSGTMDSHTAPLVAARVGQQLTRAPHVVVGLGEITVLDPRGSGGCPQAASEGHRQREGKTPRRCRARRRAPRITGLEAVIAGCRAGRIWMGCPVTQAAGSIQDIAGGGAAQPYTHQGCGGSS
jgi:hypothetical protein